MSFALTDFQSNVPPTKRIIRVASCSGGRESTAMVIKMLEKYGPDYYDVKIFANTGDDPVGKATIDHLNKYFAWNIVEVQATDVNGNKVNIFDYYKNKIDDSEPEFTGHTEPSHAVKDCSGKFKMAPIREYLRKTYGKDVVFEMHIGYSLSAKEVGRMRESDVKYAINRYPLIQELHLDREHCGEICKNRLGFVPDRSQCTMCFERTHKDWKDFFKKDPERCLEIIEFDETSKLFKKFGYGLADKPIREILRMKKPDDKQTTISCACFTGRWDAPEEPIPIEVEVQQRKEAGNF